MVPAKLLFPLYLASKANYCDVLIIAHTKFCMCICYAYTGMLTSTVRTSDSWSQNTVQ